MKNDNFYVYHIRDCINKINIYSNDETMETFENNSMMQDAIIRQIEIIGEASSKLSKSFKDLHNIVKWKNIIGMRNKLIHDYFGIDTKAVWMTVQQDIPILKKEIDDIINNFDQSNLFNEENN